MANGIRRRHLSCLISVHQSHVDLVIGLVEHLLVGHAWIVEADMLFERVHQLTNAVILRQIACVEVDVLFERVSLHVPSSGRL